ncbi:MAG: SIMPL domain-containing protein [Candidatus Riflebacteria bacterium]|nr:SIMPL domain-containing protein [Candidatus Riflebacteria bacterium]
MKTRNSRRALVLLTGLATWMAVASPAARAGDQPLSVTVTGSQLLAGLPDSVRATTAIQEKGADLKTVLAALRQRGQEIHKSLLTLGAEKESIRLSEPILRRVPPELAQQTSMLAQRPKGLRGKRKQDDIVLTTTVSARWPLAGADVDAQILRVFQLEKGLLDAAKPTRAGKEDPDDEEGDQAAQMTRHWAQGEEGKIGAVDLLYSRRLGGDEIDRALKEAFARARASAERLARASGQTLGKLVTLRELFRPEGDEDSSGVDAYRGWQPWSASGPESISLDREEATGKKFGPLRIRVCVVVTFDLKPAGP